MQYTIERLIEWSFNQSSIIIDDCSNTTVHCVQRWSENALRS